MFNAKYCRRKFEGLPTVGESVEWMGLEFKVLTVQPLLMPTIFNVELVGAFLTIEPVSEIEERHKEQLASGNVYMARIR